MTIGPEPMIMIFLMSVRRGIWGGEPSTPRPDLDTGRSRPDARLPGVPRAGARPDGKRTGRRAAGA